MADSSKIMPPELGAVFDELHQQICVLHINWRVYRDLFAESPNRIETLNQSASTFAWVIQNVLRDAMYLGLTRLSDPAESFGKKNLCFARLLLVAEHYIEHPLQQSLAGAIGAAHVASKPFRHHRDKRIAHNDLAQVLKASFDHPPRQAIEEALAAVREVMNVLHRRFGGGPMMYEHIIHQGGGDALIAYVESGIRLEELRRSLLNRQLTPESLAMELTLK